MNSSEQSPWPLIQDTFRFECTFCGECCRGDMEVFLDLYDLYKMAAYLGFDNTRLLFEQDFVVLVPGQNEVFMPKIMFKSFPVPFCPFLINELNDQNDLLGKCKLHPEYKPFICSFSPVSQELDLPDDVTVYRLVEPVPGCPGMEQNTQNDLSQHLDFYRKELAYRKRYFSLLESIRTRNDSDDLLQNDFYFFPIEDDFESILIELERKFDLK